MQVRQSTNLDFTDLPVLVYQQKNLCLLTVPNSGSHDEDFNNAYVLGRHFTSALIERLSEDDTLDESKSKISEVAKGILNVCPQGGIQFALLMQRNDELWILSCGSTYVIDFAQGEPTLAFPPQNLLHDTEDGKPALPEGAYIDEPRSFIPTTMLTAMTEANIQSIVQPAGNSSLAVIVDGYIGEGILAQKVVFEDIGTFITQSSFKTNPNRTFVSWHMPKTE